MRIGHAQIRKYSPSGDIVNEMIDFIFDNYGNTYTSLKKGVSHGRAYQHTEHLAGLLKEILNRFRKLYPDHDMVFSLVNRESRLLAERFFTKEMRVNRILTAVSFGET